MVLHLLEGVEGARGESEPGWSRPLQESGKIYGASPENNHLPHQSRNCSRTLLKNIMHTANMHVLWDPGHGWA